MFKTRTFAAQAETIQAVVIEKLFACSLNSNWMLLNFRFLKVTTKSFKASRLRLKRNFLLKNLC